MINLKSGENYFITEKGGVEVLSRVVYTKESGLDKLYHIVTDRGEAYWVRNDVIEDVRAAHETEVSAAINNFFVLYSQAKLVEINGLNQISRLEKEIEEAKEKSNRALSFIKKDNKKMSIGDFLKVSFKSTREYRHILDEESIVYVSEKKEVNEKLKFLLTTKSGKIEWIKLDNIQDSDFYHPGEVVSNLMKEIANSYRMEQKFKKHLLEKQFDLKKEKQKRESLTRELQDFEGVYDISDYLIGLDCVIRPESSNQVLFGVFQEVDVNSKLLNEKFIEENYSNFNVELECLGGKVRYSYPKKYTLVRLRFTFDMEKDPEDIKREAQEIDKIASRINSMVAK